MSVKNKFAIYSARLILIFSSLFLVICFSELNLRIFNKKNYVPHFTSSTSSGRYQPDDDLIYSFASNSLTSENTNEYREEFKVNSLGFRDDELIPKTENVIRIFVVGDSFTAGHGISTNDKTYPAVLEKILNTNTVNGKKYDIINAAVPGYTPDQEYRLITKKIINLKPDIIIWSLHNGEISDLENLNTPALYTLDKYSNLVPLSARFNWLYLQNYLFYYFPSIVKNSYLTDLILAKLPDISWLNYRPDLSKEEIIDWSGKKLLREIESVQKISQENHFQLIINILPRKEDYTVPDKNKRKKNFLESIERSFAAQNIKINQLIIEHELDFHNDIMAVGKINPENKILGESTIDPKKLFYTFDFHTNELGHEIIASITAEFIKRKSLLN
jgi:lysophospholipase L1-like esterase